MESKNKLNEVSLANVSSDEVQKIKDFENQMNDKYYIIAFDKKD